MGEMYMCPDCDTLLPAGASRCPRCGSLLEIPTPPDKPAPGDRDWKRCSSCDAWIARRARTCDRCGSRQTSSRKLTGCAGTALLVAVILVAASACSTTKAVQVPRAPSGGPIIAFRRHYLAVELATNQAEWEKGLMNRRHLGADRGMLFLFPSKQTIGFWMYQTKIPLSIAYLVRTKGQSYRVISLKDMTPCTVPKEQCQIYYPGSAYDAALEVNLHWFARHGVHVGSTARALSVPAPTR